MSRRKQSNPKPLKNELSHDSPMECGAEGEEKKGEPSTWPDRTSPDATEKMVTVLETPPPKKSESPDRPSSEDDPNKADQEEKPRIRLKPGLATDPALNMKSELDVSNPEYLASLPPAIQTALANRGLLFPGGLNLNEALASMAAAQKQARAPSVEPSQSETRTVPIYQCGPCGIRFSSLSTLEAHQTYYCSHRPNKPSEDDSKVDSTQSEDNPEKLRTGKQYSCMHCSYSADKKVSLNRHMRMHTVSPGPATTPAAGASTSATANGDGGETQDRYCTECDIRFSSQKTFRAHKMHYCNSRHVVKPTAPPSSCSGSSPTSPVESTSCRTPPSPTPQQPFLALPTNPIIIVPYSLFRSASVLPGLSAAAGVPNPDTPCFLLPNGTLQPMTSALTAAVTQNEVLKNKNKFPTKEGCNNSSGPLDLTMRRSPDLKTDEKENLKAIRSPSPEKIECEPSIHSSPCSTPSGEFDKSSPSPKRKLDDASRSNSPRASKTPKLEKSRTSPEGFDIPALHPLLMRSGLLPPDLQMRLSDLPPLPPVMPQVIVKQGVSKCKDCDIVFCKYENYLVHKKHYCSARATEDDSSKTSGSPPVSPRSGGTTSPAIHYQQLICVACGIKFTSPDNLNAHQQYYCLKRTDTEPKRCVKCRGVMEPGHQCVSHQAVAGWKCPCCDVISPTASAAQRHMETHTGVKAYRCTICKYKGNTLRGMKTHIRMHFDKRSPDLQEEKYISYILEDESIGPSGVEVAIAPPEEPSDSRPEPCHMCPQCSYSSPYKANVVRHIKLVHDVDEVTNGDDRKRSANSMPPLDEEDEIIVKKEAMEPEVIIAPVEGGATIKEEPDLPKKSLDEEVLEAAKHGGAHYCKSCDISFNYTSSFIAHKKFYCSSHAGEISNANNNNNTTRTAEASVL